MSRLLTGPAEGAQKYRSVEGQLTALLPSPPPCNSCLPPPPHGHTGGRRGSLTTLVLVLLSTLLSPKHWECFPVLPSRGKGGVGQTML